MTHLGIVGYGSFGSLLARLIAPHATVLVYDKMNIQASLPDNVHVASLPEVAASDVIIIATDLMGIEPVCGLLAPLVTPRSIVMDICSVKVKPAQIMVERLGAACRLLATHPLFGPNSVASNGDSCKSFSIVWHELAGGPFPELEELFGVTLGTQIMRMTPDEHDQQMAWVHALTFFVGRALVVMDLPDLTLGTGYYQKLRELFGLEKTHSRALFDTIEAGNPYATAIRKRFMDTLSQLDTEIKELAL